MVRRLLARSLPIILLLIITIPAYTSLLNRQYFSMHDDQHIARLYLFDMGVKQGYLYPRWVDFLGFNLGYPLFNFYPPFIYFIGEAFHLLGFSFVWSIKLIAISGFIIAAVGMYLYTKKIVNNKTSGFFAAVLYTYFLYHGVLVYVRGALAEFFAMSILPFVFLGIEKIRLERNMQSCIFFAAAFALLILTHPLIAFPALFYIAAYAIYSYISLKLDKKRFLLLLIAGFVLGLSLSAFFWLPSMLERKFTLVNDILTTERASYKIHFIYPMQLWHSLWGYGGSIAGPIDGMSLQIGKIHILIFVLSIMLFLTCIFLKRVHRFHIQYSIFSILLLIFSVFMTTQYSSFIWDRVPQLWYMQFPWRFLTFVGFFISVLGALFIYFLSRLPLKRTTILIIGLCILFSGLVVRRTYKYFKPQHLISSSDAQLISFDEVAWRISRSSFEFAPKGIKTAKSDYNTTIPDIRKEDRSLVNYKIRSGRAEIKQTKNKFAEKVFEVNAYTPVALQLNVFNFPGWTAYINEKKTEIKDDNDFKLITLSVPQGKHNITLRFVDTLPRTIGNTTSLAGLTTIVLYLLFQKLKEVKR